MSVGVKSDTLSRSAAMHRKSSENPERQKQHAAGVLAVSRDGCSVTGKADDIEFVLLVPPVANPLVRLGE